MSYLLDTNHLSPLVTPKHHLRQRVVQALAAGESFGICLPCITETIFGIGLLPRAKQNRVEWEALLPNFHIYVPDLQDAKDAAELQIALRKQGWQIETVDATIAIVAVHYQLTLLTTDKDFTAVPGLLIENWLSSRA